MIRRGLGLIMMGLTLYFLYLALLIRPELLRLDHPNQLAWGRIALVFFSGQFIFLWGLNSKIKGD